MITDEEEIDQDDDQKNLKKEFFNVCDEKSLETTQKKSPKPKKKKKAKKAKVKETEKEPKIIQNGDDNDAQ